MENMENMGKARGKKGLFLKTLERCRSLGHRKARTWPRSSQKPCMAPEGCFTVYVGPARERFVVRTECANHPLFQTLLGQAEMEYGYATGGPLQLPCDVDLFLGVLWEMDQEMVASSPRCGFARGYQLLSPARPVSMGRF